MLNLVRDYIKTKPALYDFLNRLRRPSGELERWLDAFSSSSSQPVSFIQVGANDGLRWDPIRRFVVRDCWRGVLVEPLKPVYELLRQNYSYLTKLDLRFENCAVSREAGSIKFWSYSREFLDSLTAEKKLYYLRQSSVNRTQVLRSLSKFENPERLLVCHDTPSVPLQQIVDHHFPHGRVDLIFIDAEGHDDEVVHSINFDARPPGVIVYENHNLGTKNRDLEAFLIARGYLITRLNDDTVAKRKPDELI